jgi:hypothetical protein
VKNRPIAWAVLCLALPVAGCAHHKQQSPTTRPSGGDPADRAMRDPGTYSPDWSDTSISGETERMDRKSMRRDLNNVFMP